MKATLTDFPLLSQIQRPADGTIILGGGHRVPGTEGKLVGSTEDGVLLPEITQHLSEFCRKTFGDWGRESVGEGLDRTWTGIMGFVSSLSVFVLLLWAYLVTRLSEQGRGAVCRSHSTP
jgi:hypothetical protein